MSGKPAGPRHYREAMIVVLTIVWLYVFAWALWRLAFFVFADPRG